MELYMLLSEKGSVPTSIQYTIFVWGGKRREITYAFAQGATEDTGHADYLQDRGLGDEHLVWEEGFSTQSSLASEFWTT